MTPVRSLRLVSVNVALPRILAQTNGETLMSAIAKKPAGAATIQVGRINLEGDAQTNLEKHGGLDKAVYSYPSDHWGWWETEHGLACGPGTFGENLTLAGADETGVRIGDRFAWGDTVLEITQPRVPCVRFQHHTGRADAGALMTMSGRCGWYFRVLAAGSAPTVGAFLVRTEVSTGPTVRETFFAAFDRKLGVERRREIAAHSALSEAWRKRLTAAGL